MTYYNETEPKPIFGTYFSSATSIILQSASSGCNAFTIDLLMALPLKYFSNVIQIKRSE